jgi:hypothetical protein
MIETNPSLGVLPEIYHRDTVCLRVIYPSVSRWDKDCSCRSCVCNSCVDICELISEADAIEVLEGVVASVVAISYEWITEGSREERCHSRDSSRDVLATTSDSNGNWRDAEYSSI